MTSDQEIVEQFQRHLRNWDPDGKCPSHDWGQNCTYDKQGHLIKLHLCGQDLTQIPSDVWQCSMLQDLYLENNQLSTLPAEVGKLSALQYLHLNSNQLSTLPVEIRNLTSLQNLELRSNQFSTLPAEVGNLSALQWLNLMSNQLSTLPAEVWQLTSLQRLWLSRNQFTLLPAEVGNLSALQELYLDDNQLSTLPAEIGSLSALQELDLRRNQLSILPAEMGNLSALQKLRLDNNPWQMPLPEIIAQGIPAILAYLQKQQYDETKHIDIKASLQEEENPDTPINTKTRPLEEEQSDTPIETKTRPLEEEKPSIPIDTKQSLHEEENPDTPINTKTSLQEEEQPDTPIETKSRFLEEDKPTIPITRSAPMSSLPKPEPDPFQMLSQALRRATPSVNENLLAPASITARAEQIARELEENRPATTEDDTQLLQRLDALLDASNSRIDSERSMLSQLTNNARSMASHESDLTSQINRISSQLSENLGKLTQALHEQNKLQEQHQLQEKKRNELLQALLDQSQSEMTREKNVSAGVETITTQLSSDFQKFSRALTELNTLREQQQYLEAQRNDLFNRSIDDLQSQLGSYGDAFSQAAERRPQKPRRPRPRASTVAQEALILAEAQARRELLDQQRQHQLNQSRIVFHVALALLILGVLFVFAGVISGYFFSLAASTITAGSGVVVNVISAVVFNFYKQENDRLDAITQELSGLDRATMAMQYISQISDEQQRNQAIRDLARQLFPHN
jgi:hypothetical protein